MENFYWAALGAAKGFGTAQLLALGKVFGSAQELYRATESELLATGIVTPKEVAAYVEGRKKNRLIPEQLKESCERHQISVIPIISGGYPERLKRILRPPAVLYVKGTLPDCRYSIGMVGSRMADAYGLKVAETFGRRLAQAGVVIVSGGAKGIDTASHKGALQGGGKTLAVLGCGVDIVYPPTNHKLFGEIAENGALVSEYPPGTEPEAWHFPMRNRIINGISQGIVLVEAASRSGALITAEFAMDEGRELFCVPGNIFSDKSAGPHKLIRDGARMVTSPDDILEELFPELQGSIHSNLFTGIEDSTPLKVCSHEQRRVLDLLTQGPMTLDRLVSETGWKVADMSVILLELQLKGFVSVDAAQRYTQA